MTEHGFGRLGVDAIDGVSQPQLNDIRKGAKELSKLAGVKQAHTLKDKTSVKPNKIMFEYGHISTDFSDEYPQGHTDFDKAILDLRWPKKNPKWKFKNLEKWTFDKDFP